MSLLRMLNVQGIAGLAAAIALALLLLLQKGENRHWRKQSAGFEQLYRSEQSAFAATTANYRTAAADAVAADKANSERVAAEQRAITERTADDYQARIAAARARFDELRRQTAAAAADPGGGAGAAVPGLPAAAERASEAAGQAGLPRTDQLIATEQAIQLDALIGWVTRQHAIDPNAAH